MLITERYVSLLKEKGDRSMVSDAFVEKMTALKLEIKRSNSSLIDEMQALSDDVDKAVMVNIVERRLFQFDKRISDMRDGLSRLSLQLKKIDQLYGCKEDFDEKGNFEPDLGNFET
jgi:hypothetical protein